MPIHNEDIAQAFEEMADLLEIEEANPFRVRAYRNAARTIRGMANELAKLVDEGEDLTLLPGIGKDLAGKIKEMLSQVVISRHWMSCIKRCRPALKKYY